MKIVVAYNDSEDARAAVACAADLARQSGAEVHLAHAVPGPAVPSLASPKLVEDLMAYADAAAGKDLDAAVLGLAATGVRAFPHTRRWFPVETVLDRAKEVGAALVVIGRRGSSRATQLLIGTVSSEVVRLSPISVLVVRKGGGGKGPVLVGVDGSAPSKVALQAARAVWPAAPIVACHVGAGPDVPVAHVLATIVASGVDPKTLTLQKLAGDPAEQLLAELERDDYRALVVGPRGLGQLAGLLLGSVTEKVLQLAKRPVLVAR